MTERLSGYRKAWSLRRLSHLVETLTTLRTRHAILLARWDRKKRSGVSIRSRSDLEEEVILNQGWNAGTPVQHASSEELLTLLETHRARMAACFEKQGTAILAEIEHLNAQRQELEVVGVWKPLEQEIARQARQHLPCPWEDLSSRAQALWSDLFLVVVAQTLSQREEDTACHWSESMWEGVKAVVLARMISHIVKEIEARERLLPSSARWREIVLERLGAWCPLLPCLRINRSATMLADVNGRALLEYRQGQGATSLCLITPHDPVHLVRPLRYENVPLAFLRAMVDMDVEWQGQPKTGSVGPVATCFRQRVDGRGVGRGGAGVAKDDFSTSWQFRQEVINATRASWLDRPLFLEIFPDYSWYVVPWYRLSPGYQSAGILCPVPFLRADEYALLTRDLVDCENLSSLAWRFDCVAGLMPELCRRLHNAWDFSTIRPEEKAQDTTLRSHKVSQLTLW